VRGDRALKRFRLHRWGLGLGAALLQSSIYFVIGHSQRPRSTTMLATSLDGAIPFVPWTVWWYLPFYAGIFVMAIAGFRTPRLFNRALVGVVVTMLVGAAGHLLIGAEYPRPLVRPPYGDLSLAFLGWVHAVDPPGNVFPSLHVAHTSALAVILRHDRPRLGALAMLMALLLAISTLTTKQHFVADVLAGFIIAAAVSVTVLWPWRRRSAPTAGRGPA
jgi:membrane-associated phospholipid phosphatase